MTTEVAISIGLVGITSFFTWWAYYFLTEAKTEMSEGLSWSRNLGILSFLVGLVFINMLTYSLVLMAQNATADYLTNPILVVSLEVVMWITLIGVGLYLFVLLLYGLRWGYVTVTGLSRGRKKNTGDGY